LTQKVEQKSQGTNEASPFVPATVKSFNFHRLLRKVVAACYAQTLERWIFRQVGFDSPSQSGCRKIGAWKFP